jgi:secondary thiamine-phosphate synthase enzyme
MHITASVFINDDEAGLHQDMEVWLEKLVPEKPYAQYRHNGYEDNADAHLKRSVMGREVVVAVTVNGRIKIPTWGCGRFLEEIMPPIPTVSGSELGSNHQGTF